MRSPAPCRNEAILGEGPTRRGGLGARRAARVSFPSFEWQPLSRMPEISRFYGIVIRMYYDEPPPPHFHVYYQDAQATLRIETLDLVRGHLPRRALALVLEWALAHRSELRDNWQRAERGEPVATVAPLE